MQGLFQSRLCRLCAIKISSGYNSSLVTLIVICLSTAKFKPLITALFRSSKLVLRPTVSRPVRLGVGPPFRVHGQILNVLWSDNFLLLRVGLPLWRENGSVVCSSITPWLESCRTDNHILLSHLRLLQPGGPSPRIYIPKERGSLLDPLAKTGWSWN
jgi:hypothetical protein